MRWRSTGRARATTSSTDGASRPPSSARAAGQHKRLGGARPRTPGDMAAHRLVVGRFRPSAAHQGQDRVHHLLANRDTADQCLGGEQFLGGHGLRRGRLGRAGRGEQHGAFRLKGGIADDDLQQEPVKLRLGQRVGAFLLDRVLGRQHVKRTRQAMLNARHRHTLLLHGLQQSGLRARAGAVDFISHQQLAEHGAGDETKAAAAFRLVKYFAADDVGRHQVRRELNPFGAKTKHNAQRFDQPALAEPRNADQQHVSAGQERDQGLIDNLVLAEHHLGDGRAHVPDPGAQRLHIGNDRARISMSGARRSSINRVMWPGSHAGRHWRDVLRVFFRDRHIGPSAGRGMVPICGRGEKARQ